MKKRIGTGKYRRVSTLGPNKVVKQMRSRRVKHYGPVTIKYPMRLYHLLKFGTKDMNRLEQKNYQKVIKNASRQLRTSFAGIIGIRTHKGRSILIMEKIKDYNRETSKSMNKTGKIKSKAFWKRMESIENYLLQNNIPLFDITAANIMVKKISEKNSIPVLIDFKRLGTRTYPFQPQYALKPFARGKVRRQFTRLREQYQEV